MKSATLRYYFDADILGLAKIVASLRADSTYPGAPAGVVRKQIRPACIITVLKTADTVWIPAVANAGMVAITRDSAIMRHPKERNAVVKSGARLFALHPDEAVTVWSQLELLMFKWRKIEEIARQPGPYMYRISRNSIRRMF